MQAACWSACRLMWWRCTCRAVGDTSGSAPGPFPAPPWSSALPSRPVARTVSPRGTDASHRSHDCAMKAEGQGIAMFEDYKGRRVLVTGHTGFKGAWLSQWLAVVGAEVCGIALPPDTDPSLFAL